MTKSPIKLGFIGSTFHSHSCTHVLRWLWRELDKDRFPLTFYSAGRIRDDAMSKWIATLGTVYGCDSMELGAIASSIESDKIDILIDIDSLTKGETQAVMALHPAKVTASYLGFDASGFADYFIADSLTISPEDEHHYSETIIRMPHCYLACGGFERAAESITRADLGIAPDSIVYFCGQKNVKLAPDEYRRSLMQIVSMVPDAIALIKDWAGEDSRADWLKLADEWGIADRLRFLPPQPTESLARADIDNLVDINLDSYPYNGTLTTLEMLWFGIPTVTLSGQQFSSRQGLTLLTHAGTSNGIAYDWQEYVNKAIAIGRNADHRRQQRGLILEGRNTGALWNYRQFTRDFEAMLEGLL